MMIMTVHPKSLIEAASSKIWSASTHLIPPIGCFSDLGVCFESSWLRIGGGLCLPAFRAAQAMLGPRFWPREACKGISYCSISTLHHSHLGWHAGVELGAEQVGHVHLHPQLHAQTLLLLQIIPILCAHTSTVAACRSWTSWWL